MYYLENLPPTQILDIHVNSSEFLSLMMTTHKIAHWCLANRRMLTSPNERQPLVINISLYRLPHLVLSIPS